ncbi:hypothetical protein AAFF_G00156720 [Aldrovandia affinis]|uniref:Uncharacterized protein n=1 Tax=Aldrovandia affinis TaxID=143900 RepID=A0AAD7W946_9TELE|nr:hypothetical protein AAFF_G00156720 [Aldrovandia affinis]
MGRPLTHTATQLNYSFSRRRSPERPTAPEASSQRAHRAARRRKDTLKGTATPRLPGHEPAAPIGRRLPACWPPGRSSPGVRGSGMRSTWAPCTLDSFRLLPWSLELTRAPNMHIIEATPGSPHRRAACPDAPVVFHRHVRGH